MNSIESLYNRWKSLATMDPDLKRELGEITNKFDEINDRFYKNLEFGTAGIRGVIGAGTNRINVYVVGQITQAISNYLNSLKENNCVVISFDSRIKSKLFAEMTARVFAANKIKVKIFQQLKPVPLLSYAVKFLKCDVGIMITASHNPACYNGYKIYGDDGCQIVEDFCDAISQNLKKIDYFNDIKTISLYEGFKTGLISFCDDEVECSFLNCVENCLINKNILVNSKINVIYTPLHGSGNEPVSRMFKNLNLENVSYIEQQQIPDGNFTTCRSPNPEQIEAFQLALKVCNRVKPDVVIATDPDCDRIGVLIPNREKEYCPLSGNVLGVLMLNYLCSQRLKLNLMPSNPIVFKTIVSTPMAEKIAAFYGVELENVLPGFKYIGQKISNLEKIGEQNRFIFAFEESQGFLAGTYVRDKDGVFATALVCEMVEFYKRIGKTLLNVLDDLFLQFGFYSSTLKSYELPGEQGAHKLKQIMNFFRKTKLISIGSFKIMEKIDYLNSTHISISSGNTSIVNLPKSNILEFKLNDNSKFIVRISGTEPKIKTYYSCCSDNNNLTKLKLKELQDSIDKLIDHIA